MMDATNEIYIISDYTGYVWEALELEDTVKNLGRGNTTDGFVFCAFH
jgi:hypothetical protein